jgi:hypothetical protein
MKITRVNRSVYDVAIGNKLFEIERYPDGAWLMFENRPDWIESGRPREYMQDYATLRAAKSAIKKEYER